MVFILGVLGAIVALVVLAIVLVPMFIDESALIALAQDAVRERTGGELRVDGATSLSLFPQLAVEVNDAALTIPAKTDLDQGFSAELDNLSLGVALLPILRGNTEFSALTIRGVTARITAPRALPPEPAPLPDLSDREWERLGRTLRTEREAARQRLLAGSEASLLVVVAADVLDIRDITLELLDADGRLTTRLGLESLTVKDINTRGAPMRVDTIVVVESGDDAPPLRTELNGVVRVPSDLARIDIDRLEAVIEGALTAPIRATLTGTVKPSPLDIETQLNAALPGGDVTGELRYATLNSPQITVRLNSERLDLDRLQPAGTRAKDTPTNATPLPPVPLPVGPLRMLDLDMTMTATQLLSAGQTIDNAQLAMRVVDGVATLNHLRGTLHGGQLDTRAVINTRRQVAELTIDGGMKGVDLNALFTSLGSARAMSGRVDMAWDLESEGATAEALKLGLDGDLTAAGSDVVIEALSLQGLMCDAIARINQQPLTEAMPRNTPLTALNLAVDFEDGRASIDELALATPGLTMRGTGAVALSTLDFDLTVDSRLDEQLTELDPACDVRERYRAIAWPIACRGNLGGDPKKWCGVDANRIAEQLLRNEAKSQLEKNAGKITEKANQLLKKLID